MLNNPVGPQSSDVSPQQELIKGDERLYPCRFCGRLNRPEVKGGRILADCCDSAPVGITPRSCLSPAMQAFRDAWLAELERDATAHAVRWRE